MRSALGLPNAREVLPDVISAGQPSPAQLQAAAAAGVTTIIDLRSAGECGWDEAQHVKDLGLRYVHLPVAGPQDITTENARRLHAAVMAAERPVVVHCGSGNRVGALFALVAFQEGGCDIETAIARGKAAGLTLLEPRVRQLLTDGE